MTPEDRLPPTVIINGLIRPRSRQRQLERFINAVKTVAARTQQDTIDHVQLGDNIAE